MKKISTLLFSILLCSTLWAALPYNTTLTESIFNNSKSNAVKDVDWSDGIRLGYYTRLGVQNPGREINPLNNFYEKSIVISLDPNHVASSISFSLHCQSASGFDATQTDFKIFESPNGTSWEEAFSANIEGNKTAAPYSANLKKTTKYLKFYYSGNYAGIFSNIKTINQIYVHDPEPASIDFGTKPLGADTQTESFSIEWCDVSTLNITQNHPEWFIVSPQSFGATATFGNANIEVQYSHNELGTHSDELTISNGTYTKTVTVSGATDRRPQVINWAEQLASTGFVMSSNEVLPNAGVSIIATASNAGEILFESSDPSVISVSSDGKTLTAVSNGTAIITARQAGDAQYLPAETSQLFTVTAAAKQTISWDQDLMSLKVGGANVTLTATASSGGDITYSSDDENVVKISGSTLQIIGDGEAYVTATQTGGVIYGTDYAPISKQLLVVVSNPSNGCVEMSLSVSSLDLTASSKEYTLQGVPSTIKFSANHDTKDGSWGYVSYAALIVEEYSTRDGVTEWYPIFNQEVNATTNQAYGPYTLSESATKIRFRTGESATTHISDIRVYRKTILRATPASVTEVAECNTLYSKTIRVIHQNVDKLVATVSGPFSLDRHVIGSGCSDIATDELVVSFLPTEKTTYTGSITITDGKNSNPNTVTIPLSIDVQGLTQIIQGWTLNDGYTGLESPIILNAVASSELPVEYSSSDESVARIENGHLIAVAPGTVTITASQPGNDRFNPAVPQQRVVTIVKTDASITAVPTVSEISQGDPLSAVVISGGEANVEGSFRWELPTETLLPAGTHTLNLIFDATASALFDADTVAISLTVRPARSYGEQTLYFCAGDSIQYYGVWYKQETTTQVIISNIAGGDSIIDLTVLSYPSYNITDGATICASELPYVWETETFTQAGSKTLTLQTINGCDSVVTFTLTVNPEYQIAESKTMYVGKDSVWHGKDLSVYAVGEHTIKDELTTVNGCDSVFTLTLNVLPLPTSSEDIERLVCAGDSIEMEDKYYKVGTYTLNYHNILGGDSVINLTVTELPVYSFTESRTQFVGKSGTWHGKDLSIYPVGEHVVYDSLKTAFFDCDSVYALNLTIEALPTSESTVEAAVCPGETIEYDGNNYGAGLHTLRYTNILGGDSIIKLAVSIYPTYEGGFEMQEIIEGTAMMWNNHDLSQFAAGDVYYLIDTLATIHGCDSIVTLELWVNERPSSPITKDTAYVCPGEEYPYNGNGQVLTEAKNYRFELKNIYGGDSVVIFTLKHYPTAALTIPATICPGDSVLFGGKWYKEAGSYVDSLTTIHGCDSVVTLVLDYYSTYSVSESVAITYGDAAPQWHNMLLSTYSPGEYNYVDTLSSVHGCDSICHFTLTVNRAPQSLSWLQSVDTVIIGETAEFSAQASSGLEVTYTLNADGLAEWDGNILTAISAGKITLVAEQAGNEYYLPAEPLSLEVVIDAPTGLEDLIHHTPYTIHKILHNGVLYIIQGKRIYDSTGQLLQ